jgi:ubiquitin-activating enzyme E1 C
MVVVDLDTIDISNLNRQFLFRMSDVGKSKAQAAADFIMKRVPGCVVTPYQGKVQEKDEDFYRQFKLIISGLDNIEARRWLNSVIVGTNTQLVPLSRCSFLNARHVRRYRYGGVR